MAFLFRGGGASSFIFYVLFSLGVVDKIHLIVVFLFRQNWIDNVD